jgi:hypothetical protein
MYDRFSLEFPEWNLKFRTDKPLRMFEHIHHCMQIGSVKEILYKAGLDEFAANLDDIEDYNCLMFYLDKYVNNQTDILFLRKAECKEDSYVTVEIREGKMVQAFLKYNEKPDKEVMEWLKMYARKKGFEVELEEYE